MPVDLAGEPEAGTKIEDDAELAATVAKQPVNPDSLIPGEDDVETARIYFGAESMGGMGAMQPWAPGEGSMLRVPGATDYAALPPPRAAAPREGQSVASKGEVTGADQRPKSPAERSGSASRAGRAPRRRSVSPTRSTSSRAANPCAARSRSLRW